jgi:pilus assembly protein TadC
MARVRLYQRIGFLRHSVFLRKYEKYLDEINLKVDPLLWMTLSFLIALIVGILTYLLLQFFSPVTDPVQVALGTQEPPLTQSMIILVFVMFFVAIDLLIGYPWIKGIQRINSIENELPEALKQMADILKAGGTYEYALREISHADFGPLTVELENVLRKLEEGENFEDSLSSLAYNVDSRLVKRSVTIIIDSVKAGAGLADVLEEIAEDIRDTNRIHHERRSQTLMQVLFMVTAGAIVTPFIFGLISTIIGFLISSSANLSGLSDEIRISATSSKQLLLYLLQIYVFVEVTASSVMISLMREGKKNKSIIYLPVLLFIGYTIFFISQIVSKSIISGIGGL